jgi:hypothetical protein
MEHLGWSISRTWSEKAFSPFGATGVFSSNPGSVRLASLFGANKPISAPTPCIVKQQANNRKKFFRFSAASPSIPEISRFFGIVIKMFFDDHNPPHFHAEYGGHLALIDIRNLSSFSGHLPPRVGRNPSRRALQ